MFAVDQTTKHLVVTRLAEHERVQVIGEALQWVYVKNPGAAFSFGVNATWLFTILSTVVAVFVVTQIPKIASVWWGIFMGLLLGGTLGNVYDRLLREPGFPNGHVVDFIYTPWMMPAVYNVADIGIVVGMSLFVLLTLFGVRIDGTPRRVSKAAEVGLGVAADGVAADGVSDSEGEK